MPATSAISRMVGKVLNSEKRSTVSMPMVPRDTMRDRPPVRRSRWNLSDRACRWRKVRTASSFTARWLTLAKTASRIWASTTIMMRAKP